METKSDFTKVIGAVIGKGILENIDATEADIPNPVTNMLITSSLDGLFCLRAPVDTGKPFIVNAIHAFQKLQIWKVIWFANSRSGASLLRRSAQSAFIIPLQCRNSRNFPKAPIAKIEQAICDMDYEVWDDTVMYHMPFFEAVDKLYKNITKNSFEQIGLNFQKAGIFRFILLVLPGGPVMEFIMSKIFQFCNSLVKVLHLTANESV